jgi:TfoX/Sxy family transcriptional regulator of competence genes
MAYDEHLAARVRTLLAPRTDVSERKMFGGLTFMIGGNMCCGVNGDELIVRLDPDREVEALARPHARPMDFTGRPMRGFVTVQPDGLNGDRLNRWVQEAVARAESLPPK